MAYNEHKLISINERFSASDSDITVTSSDGVLFKLHRRNLEMHSGAFPGIEVPTNNEIVVLSESAEVLELLFQYMYKQRQPELHDQPFDVAAAVVEGVEKYEVFPAMEVCKSYMRMSIPNHPLEVLHYASRHRYFELCDAAAPSTLRCSSQQASKALVDSTIFMAWVLYRDAQNPVNYVPPPYTVPFHPEHCNRWFEFEPAINKALLSSPRVRDVDIFVETYSSFCKELLVPCSSCESRASDWRTRLLPRKRQRNSPFSPFLNDQVR